MTTLIIGAGRVGKPIGEAIRDAGHQTVSIRSDSTISSLRPWNRFDLLILAAAWENPEKYEGFDDFNRSIRWIRELPQEIPLAGVTNLSRKRLNRVAPDRPAVRFMCTSAIGARQESLRFYDETGAPEAINALQTALPSPSWSALGPDDFDDCVRLFPMAALFCAVLSEVETAADLSDTQRGFLSETVIEAYRMIRAKGSSPRKALESAATPGGMTEQLAQSSLIEDLADYFLHPDH